MLEQPVAAGEMSPVINPAEPKDIVGFVREATPREVEQALESAVNNAPICLPLLRLNARRFCIALPC
ncbi:hypothetical protein ACLK1X_05840 [Escherichia coli]